MATERTCSIFSVNTVSPLGNVVRRIFRSLFMVRALSISLALPLSGHKVGMREFPAALPERKKIV